MVKNPYFPRKLAPKLKEYLSVFPVIGLMGPRQAGKSTMLRNELPEYHYVSFDDHRQISLFNEDPHRFIELYNDKVIFDEVQKMPKLFDLIKWAIDQNRFPGRYILTGSSQFLLHQSVTESLAGRIGLLQLLPFQYSEIRPEYRDASIYKGSYPEVSCRGYTYSEAWYSSYIDTYLTKDVRQLFNIIDLNDFRRFLGLIAARTSQVLDLSELANQIDISVPTIKRWVSILEASYILFLLPPYYSNLGKRLTKRPKVYFYDTGLVSFLTGITTPDQYHNGPMSGSIFETYIISEIKKNSIHQKDNANLYYFRSSDGKEIDLIVETPTKKTYIEIKKNHTFRAEMTRTLQALMPTDAEGLLIYCGEPFPIAPRVNALPYHHHLPAI